MKHTFMSAVAAGSLLAVLMGSGAASAQSRADAEAAMARLGLTGNENITYGSTDWSNGRYILNDVTIRVPDTPDAGDDDADDAGKGGSDDADSQVNVDVDVSFDELHIERIVFDALRLDDDGEVMFDGLSFDNLTAEEPEVSGSLRVAHIGVEDPNAVMVADLVRGLSGEIDDDYEPDWSDYSFSSFSMEGFSGTGDEGEGPFSIALEQLAIQDFSDVELGRFALIGMDFDLPNEDGSRVLLRVGELSVTGLKTEAYSEFLDAVSSGADENSIMSAYYRASAQAQPDIYERIAMRDLLVEADGVHVAMDNLTAQIDRSRGGYNMAGMMDSLRLVPDASMESGAQLAMAIGMLGYEDLELSMQTHSVYDEASGRMHTVGDNYVQLRDGVRIEFAQDFDGYDEYYAQIPDILANMPDDVTDEDAQSEMMMRMLAPVVLNNLMVRIVDQSLLDRALDAGAAAQGLTKDEFRIQTAAMAGMGLMAAPPEVPRTMLAELSTALSAFINQGGSLTIDVSPAEPLSVGEWMEQVEAGNIDFDALGLSFTAEAPE